MVPQVAMVGHQWLHPRILTPLDRRGLLTPKPWEWEANYSIISTWKTRQRGLKLTHTNTHGDLVLTSFVLTTAVGVPEE